MNSTTALDHQVSRQVPEQYEIIDVAEFARRLSLPASWVRSRCRSRAVDGLPVLKLGRNVRLEWGSPALQAWVAAHRRISGKDR